MFFNEKLKKQWEENPLGVVLIGAIAASAASKLINALSGIQSRRAYARSRRFR